MLFLGGKAVPVDVDELRPVQPDPVGAVMHGRGNLLGELDVGPDEHPVLIERRGRLPGMLEEAVLDRFVVPFFLLVAADDLRVGVDDDGPRRPVDDDDVPRLGLRRDLLEPHDSRDLVGPGHDGGVGGLAAHVGGESLDLLHLHLHRIGRREIAGNDDGVIADPRDGLVMDPGQVSQYSLPGVLHVADPLAQVLVIDLAEDVAILVEGHPQGPLGIDPLVLDVLDRLPDEHLVLEDHDVDVEDVEGFQALLVLELALDLQQLVLGVLEGLAEPADLVRNEAPVLELVTGDGGIDAPDQVGHTDGHPGGDAESLQDDGSFGLAGVHAASPNFSSTSFAMLFTASRASSPSARTTIRLSFGQARVRMSRRLLASTWFPSLSRNTLDR